MRDIPGLVIVLGVVALFWGVFALGDWMRRAARRNLKDPSRILPGPRGRREVVERKLDPAQVVERIAAAFAGPQTVVTHRDDRQIILFRGREGGSLQFGGILSARPEQMPILVAAMAGPGRVTVTVANDFGWNLFAGPARSSYNRLVAEAVEGAVRSARAALGT